jgi:hypothetical protein
MTATLNTLLDTINTLHPNADAAFKGELLAKVIADIDTAMHPAKPIDKPALKVVGKPADKDDWKGQAAVRGSKQHIRIIAAELAIMDAYEGACPIDGYSDIEMFDTKGEMSDHYAALRPYLDAVSGLDIRFNSNYWKMATNLLK